MHLKKDEEEFIKAVKNFKSLLDEEESTYEELQNSMNEVFKASEKYNDNFKGRRLEDKGD